MTRCSSCQAEVPAGERYCGACGYDTHKNDHIETVLEPKLRQARGWILAVGIIYLASAAVQVAIAGDRVSSDEITFSFVTAGALFAIHLGLWWWAKTAPFAAALVALVLFVTLQVVWAAIDPESLARGLIIKVLFLIALIQAVKAGVDVQRLRRERN